MDTAPRDKIVINDHSYKRRFIFRHPIYSTLSRWLSFCFRKPIRSFQSNPMNNADAATLLTCTALASYLWYTSPTGSLFTPFWLGFFCFICFKDEIRWTLEESVPWLSPLIAFCIFALCLFIYILRGRFFSGGSIVHHGVVHKYTEHGDREQILKPLLFPATTTHTRFFPQKLSFSYSYLLVGIPVGWRGAIGSYLAVDLPSYSPPSWTEMGGFWFSVNADDYLERGSNSPGLQEKLYSYLQTQVGPLSLLSCNMLRIRFPGRSHR